jgi:hypothetical protein
MKKTTMLIILILSTIFLTQTSMTNKSVSLDTNSFMTLVYNNIWGTIYNPTAKQCDGDPTKTADGSHINPRIASKLRWVAISQDLINDQYRAKLVNNPKDKRFKGYLAYGDTVWIESAQEELVGWWVVRDSKNKYLENSIDFLQTEGDKRLYKGDKQWPGKWRDISIYKVTILNYQTFNQLRKSSL